MVAIGKLDGDAFKDMAVATANGRTVSVFLAEGPGNFADSLVLDLDGEGTGVAIAKVDGDNRADIVATINRSDPGPDGLQVFRGTGGGGFAQPKNYNLPDKAAQDLALADLDKDGRLDAITGQGQGSAVVVSYGTGNGKFANARSYEFPRPDQPTPSEPQWVDVGDFNRDGFKDIATSIGRRDEAGVLYTKTKRKNGKLRAVKGKFKRKAYEVDGFPFGVEAGDFDRDGKLDLATANDYGSLTTVSILYGKGNGKRAGFKPHQDLEVGDQVFGAPAVGFFDEDNRLDIAVSRGDGDLAFLFGRPGGFQPYETYGLVNEAISLTAAELNGDGETDLAVPQWNLSNVAIVLEEGDGED
jgi:hypothetical protein